MNIESHGNTILLTDFTLQNKHKSQLQFWNFRILENKTIAYNGIDTQKVLIRIINYFNKENIVYKLSESCNDIIKEYSHRINEFEITKRKGLNFKEGKYDKLAFAAFKDFIKHTLVRPLKQHQIKAAYHLYLLRNAANFSVPGSGKTSVVITVYEKLRMEQKVNTLFVVGPPAIFASWKTEFATTLGREPKTKILAGGNRSFRKSEYFATYETKKELYLTTFQTLINDQSEICTLFTQKNIKVFLVVDEAHYIKQLNGNWANAVLNISKNSTYRCILTGTPLPKSYSDIFNLFEFLWPEEEVIESKSKIQLQIFEQTNQNREAGEMLDKKIGPLYYRVRKKELELKEQVFHPPIVVQMNHYERLIYDAVEKKIRNYAKEDYLKNIELVNKLRRGRMMRLRQSMSYTKLLSTAIFDYDETILNDNKNLASYILNYDELEMPAKLVKLIEMLLDFKSRNEKVVIWSNFVGNIERIGNYLNKNIAYCKSIYGKIPIEQENVKNEVTREKIRNEFVDEGSGLNILIANPAACSESISLHKTCHNAIYYDLSYNCAQYLQSLDRIHRVGGSEQVEANYYFLQYDDTIDSDIFHNLQNKARKMNQIIDKDYEIYSMDMFDDSEEVAAYKRLFTR